MNKRILAGITGSEKLAETIMSKPFIKRDWKKDKAHWISTFVGAFISKNPERAHVLDMVCEALGKTDIEWKDLTKVNLIRISDYINSQVSPNSAATYLHVLHALLSEYSEEKSLPVQNLKGALKARRAPSQHVALTADELRRFETYEPQTKAERDIKCLFLRACYTGARCSDAKLLSAASVIKTDNGDLISYVSKKTKTEVVLPLHQNLRKYLLYRIEKDYSAKTTSEVVRRICRNIGINEIVSLYVSGKMQTGEKWEFITMHSARRTFCTILAQMGVGVETIRSMAGHSTSAMTDRYICLDGRNPGADAMRFFGGNEKKKSNDINIA